MNQYIDIILEKVKKEYSQSSPPWMKRKGWSSVPRSYRQWIQRECAQDSEFDTLRLRKRVLDQAHPDVTYATCRFGEVVAVYESPHTEEDVPWELWGRILRMYHRPASKPFRIYFLASNTLREFPASVKESIQPQHINGGYTYPCHHQSIVIYRAEDATRVLLHELQHACCLDHQERGLDRVEAETEAWAELLYTALLSQGSPSVWKREWTRQWNWIIRQNQRVQRHMKSPLSMEFPWRYTIGKEQVFREWFHTYPAVSSSAPIASLRLTVPPTPAQKQEQKVRQQSVIL
jgi:hypothetical protein